MDVITLLAAQHAAIEALVERLCGTTGDRPSFDELLLELADTIATHTGLEDKLVFTGATEVLDDRSALGTELRARLDAARTDHAVIRRSLADLLALDPELDRSELDGKLRILARRVREAHHREETRVFPSIRETLGSDRCVQIGGKALAMVNSLLGDSPLVEAVASAA